MVVDLSICFPIHNQSEVDINVLSQQRISWVYSLEWRDNEKLDEIEWSRVDKLIGCSDHAYSFTCKERQKFCLCVFHHLLVVVSRKCHK